jgi:hypothetical protein
MPLVIRTTTGHHGGAEHSKSLEAESINVSRRILLGLG